MPAFMGAGAFQEIGVKAVVKDIAKFMSDLGRMDKAVQTTGQNLQRRGAVMQGVGMQATKFLTLPILAAGAVAVKTFADFDAAMTQSLAIMTGVTDEMREKMEKAARDVAKTTTFSAKEAAGAYYFLASAGMDAATSMEALPIVARFAQAGMFDLETATELLADAQSALGLRVKDPVKNMENLVRVSDVLTEAANASNASVMQFSEALTTKAAARLRAYNKSVEEGIAVLAVFADAGIKGTIAGERLDMVYRYLADSAVKNAEAYAAYGIAVFDATGKMRNMADIVGDFEKALAGASDQQKVMILNTLGLTAESQSGLLALLGNSEAIRTYEKRLLSAGGATETVAQKQLKTFNAQMKLLWHKIQDVLILLGKQLVPILQDAAKIVEAAVKVFAKLVGWFAALPKPVRMVVIGLVLLLAAIGPLLMIFGQLVIALGGLMIFGPIVAAKLATMIPVLMALSPWILAFIGVALILIATAPLIVAAWGPVSQFFSKILPDALGSAGRAIPGILNAIVRFGSQVVTAMVQVGRNIAVGIANGIAAAAGAIWAVLKKIVEAITYALNPFNYVFPGSNIVQVFEHAGTRAGTGYTKALSAALKKGGPAAFAVPGSPEYEPGGRLPAAPKRGMELYREVEQRLQPAAKVTAQVDVELGDVSGLDELEEEAEEAGAAAGTSGGNAFLRMLEGVVARGLGTVTRAMAAPLEALRGVVQSLSDEMLRLAGLPTVESAAERLQRAQLQLQLLGVRAREGQMEAARERITAIDDEAKALMEQRQAIIDENWGREEGVEAIDAQLTALDKEKKGKQSAIDAYEAEKKAIEDQIDALDLLAERRTAEREVLMARAQMADKTLATDAEVLAQMEKMRPVISEVTGLINKQAEDLWTRFIPAWEDALAAAAAGAGAGAGAAPGVEMPEVGAVEGMPALGPIEAPEMPDLAKGINDWINSMRPYLLAAGVTILAIVLFGWNVGLVVAVVAAVALLIYKFRDEIWAGIKWLGGQIGKLWKKLDIVGWVKKLPEELKKHWKKVVQVALLILFPPGAGLFAIITNFDKIKDAVIRIVGEIAEKVGRLFSGLVRTVTGLVSGLVTAVVGFFSRLVTQVVGFVSGLVTQVVGFFSGLVTSVVGLVSGLITSIVSFFSGLPGRIVGALSGLAGMIGGIASTAVSGFLSFFEGLPGTIGGFFAGIPGAIVGALGDFGQFLWDNIVQPIIDTLSDIANIEIFGISLNDLIDLLGGIGKIISTLPGLQLGEWSVPGGGARDSVPAMLTPGEMIVPQAIARKVRAAVGGFGQLGAMMAGAPADMAPAMQRMAMPGVLSVSAPISVTVYSHDWAEVRRIVHAEVDTALARARDATTRQAAELTSGIV